MAAPAVQDADTTTGTNTASTSWTLTYPSNIAAGDLILVFMGTSNSASVPSSSGFIGFPFSGNARVLKKKATGSESGTFTVTWDLNASGHWAIYRITGWDGNIGSSWGMNFSSSATNLAGSVISAETPGTSATPDPPTATSDYWATGDDVLWIAFVSSQSNDLSGGPSGYTNVYTTTDGGFGGAIGIARKTSTSNTENPGTFTNGASTNWGGITIGIRAGNGGPIIMDGDTKIGSQTSNSASWTATYPTNIQSGDLLLIFAGSDGSGATTSSFTAPGFTRIEYGGSTASVGILAKVADGTETGTFTLSMAASEQGTWVTQRVTNWFGGLPSGFETHDGTGIDANVTVETTSTTPNPPNLDPGGWGAEMTLWFAIAANDGTATTSAWPTGFNRKFSLSSGGAGGANLMFATLIESVSAKDPGTFTIGSEQWTAITLAVRPAAAAAPAAALPLGATRGAGRDRYGLMSRASALRPGIWLPNKRVIVPA